MFPAMMGGMLPPPIQALLDALPEPGELELAAEALGNSYIESSHEEAAAKTAKFLLMVAQLMKQQGVVDQGNEPSEPLKVGCKECGMEFGVDNAMAYYAQVQKGRLYACANGHPPHVVGSGRLGELTVMEAEAQSKGGDMTIIYSQPSDPEPTSASDSDS